MIIRLDKFLADLQLGTRSEVKTLVKKGQVQVNSLTVKNPEYKINTELDLVEYAGKSLQLKEFLYYMVNKPAGYVTATRDNREKTVMELLHDSKRKDLFPIGRLDKDTEGLLLITNDGMLSHKLMSPKKHVSKTYYATIDGTVEDENIELFLKGLDIGEKRLTLPAQLTILKSAEQSQVLLTITEGKFHQVKRMFEVIGRKVIYLKRISIGKLSIDEKLSLGDYRELTEEEIYYLKNYE